MTDDEKEVSEIPVKEEEEDKEKAENEGEEGGKSKRKRKRKRKKKNNENADESGEVRTSTDATNKADSVEHTVFVEGIPFVASEEQVKEFFTSNGITDILEMRLPRYVIIDVSNIVFSTSRLQDTHYFSLDGKILEDYVGLVTLCSIVLSLGIKQLMS